jgi:hypothetical protein
VGLALLAAIVCVESVAWAFRGYFYICGDEIGNLVTRAVQGPRAYLEALHLLPHNLYNDRPAGFILEWLLFDWFGFEYSRQLVPYIAFHVANCCMTFFLARRLGASVPTALAAMAAFGGTCVTALTATCLGAVFDVLCAFFTLACFLAFLSGRRVWGYASAGFFLLALRSKEYAIVIPFLLAAFAMAEASGPLLDRAKAAARRLWPHFLLLAIFAGRYLSLMLDPKNRIEASSPYHLELSVANFFKSLLFYTGLAFGREQENLDGLLIFGALLLALLVYAWRCGNKPVLLCLTCYAALLSLVCCLPHIRAPFYVYGPQAFLWLAVLLALEAIASAVIREEYRRSALAVLALLVMLLLLDFRVSDYFRNRINWVKTARLTNTVTARSVRALGVPPAGSHVYLNAGSATPYLLSWNSGDYLRILNRRPEIVLINQKPERELLELYAADPAEKVFWDYRQDGALSLRMRSNAAVSERP